VIDKDAILFDDSYITVVNKPHGLQCEPDKNGHPDLCNELRKYFNKINKPAKIIQPVNRLDRPVGGIVLIAKKAAALVELNRLQENREIHKTYTALVDGIPSPAEATLSHYILKDVLAKKSFVSNEPKKDAKPCQLSYQIISVDEDVARLEIELHTGRYHQIRAQLAFIGHPVFGDLYYGSKNPFLPNSICLHASRLVFPHPITKDMITVESSPFF